jgi:Cdc6-like AAA superfamily ATPase
MAGTALQRARNAFHRSSMHCVYLRADEVKHITGFLESDGHILHVCGSPGTGKTLVVMNVMSKLEHMYLNFFSTSDVFAKVKASSITCFVVDEFDKYEHEKKNESKLLLMHIVQSNKKLITISNKLSRSENVLFFKPYLPEEIEEIIVLKLRYEVGEDLLDIRSIKHVAKRFLGDIRQAYEHCLKIISGSVAEDACVAEDTPNIHKEIVRDLVAKTRAKSRNAVFAAYVERCRELSIRAYGRSDFGCLYDMFE